MVGFGGEMEITRRCANHHPSVWGDHFLAYANLSRANEWEEKEHEDQKGGVRKMLVMAPSKSLQKLELINTIQLLGVAYHFEHNIEESLSEIYNDYEEWIGEFDESDLHVVALSFRLLRQQGYYVSSGMYPPPPPPYLSWLMETSTPKREKSFEKRGLHRRIECDMAKTE
ncbi:hypothetical protein MTR67_032395 [Solanum verrucosum]|uniref:Terpene synthase N-terminal domain-containing protein n=1 Tax=Solanum verrucosum TaxID=315347 RepID=A0AAF0U465_SOLVR|nr:hypothetical protein MTR67_032395 [Solanum verrucosum]